ncbi:MAG: MATE family efflux transporter [Bacteroidota bacterium]
MNYRQHIRENLRLALPVMLSNLGHVLMGVTDNVMVGHINAVSLAAAGLATVVFNVLLLFGIGVSYAITPLVATAHGEQNDGKIVDVVRHGLVINFLNSLVLIACVFVAQNLLYKINQPAEVVSLAIPFLNIICYSLIPVMIFQTFKQYTEGLSHTDVAMIIMIGANVVNVLLNYLLVFGHLGFPAMGLEGSGWATFYSRVFMAIAIIVYVYYNKRFKKYRAAFSFVNYSRDLFKKLLNLGIPSGVQFIFEVAAFDFSLVMMGWLGVYTQAAHQIAINLATISYMTTAGLASAATIRVGYFLGRRDFRNMHMAAHSLLGMALAVMCVWAVLFIFGRYWLPSLYVNDPGVISIASSLLVIAGLFQLSDGTQVVCIAALRGLLDVKIPSALIFISYWIIGLPLGYYLAFVLDFGGNGVWWGLFIGLTLTATAMFARLRMLMSKLQLQPQPMAIQQRDIH